MADTTRTFVAVAVPESLAARLRRLQQDLAPEVPEARMAVTPPFHVTLAFLGDVPHVDLSSVCRAVNAAAEAFSPFELTLQGVGAFPDPTRPRVLWAGLTGPGVETLHALQAVDAQAAAATGYPGDTQAFHPHVTLGRIKSGHDRKRGGRSQEVRDLTSLLARRLRWFGGNFKVGEVVTFSSSFDPEKRNELVYAPLSRGTLRGKAK
ncbi:MAG: RNA 2',3'-cyclic phosphodiesterase [Isosphaeraceae bacterium]